MIGWVLRGFSVGSHGYSWVLSGFSVGSQTVHFWVLRGFSGRHPLWLHPEIPATVLPPDDPLHTHCVVAENHHRQSRPLLHRLPRATTLSSNVHTPMHRGVTEHRRWSLHRLLHPVTPVIVLPPDTQLRKHYVVAEQGKYGTNCGG